MSTVKNISSYPSTGQGFSINHNRLQNIKGVFLTKKDFTITSAQLESDTYLFDQFELGNVIPLHFVLDVIPKNEETEYGKSVQDFTYKLRDGKYRHVLRFDWELAFSQIVESYSGTDLNVIYYDNDQKLILTTDSQGVYRGIKTNRLVLEKPNLFGNGTEVQYSDLDIEIRDSEEITLNGYIAEVDWLPEQIDKRFVSVSVESVGVDYLNFIVKRYSQTVDNLSATDVSVTDTKNGILEFSVFNLFAGVYKLSSFNEKLTTGCLSINSSGYLGRTKYQVQISIIVDSNFVYEDGNNLIYENGDNIIFEN